MIHEIEEQRRFLAGREKQNEQYRKRRITSILYPINGKTEKARVVCNVVLNKTF